MGHRDLKPGNVFMRALGEIKLLDFGIASRARNTGSTLGLETPNAGTAGYRAPEAGTHQGSPRPQLDVYAVAVMIYQLLEGAMPFGEQRAPGVQPAKPSALNDAQWTVLQRGFALDAGDPPPCVAALLDARRSASGPSKEELAARAAEEKAKAAREQELAREAELQRKAETERQRQDEVQRQLALAEQRKQQAQAAAIEKVKQEQLRRELEKQRKIEAEEAARARKENLRQQLIARREADALKARQAEEERQRKLAQLKAEAAYRLEQDRHRKEEAARKAAELAALAASPVADANGVLRDRFLDGTGKGPDLVLIPTGRFQMGSTEYEHSIALKAGSQPSQLAKELPAHWVGIERSFALGRFPVTVREWRQFVHATGWESKLDVSWSDPGFKQTDDHPVVCVSWDDAQLYVQWLSGKTGQVYRLPSEAEWEYACRAGTHTAFSFGDEISTEHANYDGHFTYNHGARGESRGGTTAVNTFQPNPWGLFDMHGNVWEWVQDVVHENYVGAPADGSAWEEGGDQARRVLRGGAWLYQPRYLRSALRNGYSAVLANDVVGFRVARKLA
jgi:formylglycine-generating enzyme required for sulfatase activity